MLISGRLDAPKGSTRTYLCDLAAKRLTITTVGKRTEVDGYDIVEHGPGDWGLVKRGEALPEGVPPTTYQVIAGKGCTCPHARHRQVVCKHAALLADVISQLKWIEAEAIPF